MKNLIRVLEASRSKHGDKTPLTIGHLLNIAKAVDRLDKAEAKVAANHEARIFKAFCQGESI